MKISNTLNSISNIRSHIRADLWLLFVTFVWGASFPLVKIGLENSSPFLFLSIRFFLGGLLLYLFMLIRKIPVQWQLYRKALPLGIFLFIGMQLQTVGLKYTEASKSAFITGLCVVFVPILVVFIEKKKPKKASVIGVILATIGIYIFANPLSGQWNRGDLFTLLGAVSFAFEIILVEMLVKQGESESIALFTILFTAAFAMIGSIFFEKTFIHPSYSLMFSLGFVALFCTALGFQMQMYWQPKTTATAAGVIYTTEPVFAALFAMWLLQETLAPKAWLGAGLIMSGMLIAELRK
ncbi:DMT family transporter [candidate division KSB1 bacterium]|nr:DMT family transporter [candidate division KSB1 bacterium]